jgi:Tfp pilus assembly protein PilN
MSSCAMNAKWNNGNSQANGGRQGRACWRPLEIAAMVLGFIVYWPIGLAILFLILWQHQQGRALTDMPPWMARLGPIPAMGPAPRGTGNSAFEEWKQAELDRLEEERRRLATAQQEFEDFLTQLKRARDREEFDRFMAARAKPAEG